MKFKQACLLFSLPKWYCGILRWLLLIFLLLAWFDPYEENTHSKIIFLLDCSESIAIIYAQHHSSGDLFDRKSFYESFISNECKQYSNAMYSIIFFGQDAELAVPFQKWRGETLPIPKVHTEQTRILPALDIALVNGNHLPCKLVIVSDGHWQDCNIQQLLTKIPDHWEVVFYPAIPSTHTFFDASLDNLYFTPTAVQGGYASGTVMVKTNRAGKIQIKIASFYQQSNGPIHSQQTSGGPIHSQQTSGGPIHSQQTSGGPIHSQTTSGGPIHSQTTNNAPAEQPTSGGPIEQPTSGAPAEQQADLEQTVDFFLPGTWEIPFFLPIPYCNGQTIHVTITPEFDDICPDNQSIQASINILQPGKILWVGDNIPTWLLPNNKNSSQFVVIPYHQLTEQLQHFPQDVIVLSQGTALELMAEQPLLHDYVFYGGGLLVIGDESTLGPGGYSQTLLEKMLPVWSQDLYRPNIVLWIILDVSGSMSESYQGIEKLKIAQQGLLHICQNLRDDDCIGIVTFRQTAQYILPLKPWRENRYLIQNIFSQLYAQGSTNLANALTLVLENAVAESTPQSSSSRRHLWIISDGLDTQANADYILSLGSKLYQKSISISTIATGTDSQNILANLANSGGGKFYTSTNISFMQQLQYEWQRIQHPGVLSGKWPVQTVSSINGQWPDNHSAIKKQDSRDPNIESQKNPNIESQKNPSIESQKNPNIESQKNNADKESIFVNRIIPTRAKDWGTVLLTTPQYPLCVIGNYGQGRSAVWTSQFGTSWLENAPTQWQKEWLDSLLAWLQTPARTKSLQVAPITYPIEYTNIGQINFPDIKKKQPTMPIYSWFSDMMILLSLILFLIERWLWLRKIF